MQYLDAVSKTTEWTPFISKAFNITVIHVCTSANNAKEDEVEWFYEDLQDLLD